MFKNGAFSELKGCCFDPNMKKAFVDYFSRSPLFEIYYIVTDNHHITDSFCSNASRAYNYLVCKSLLYFRNHNLIPNERCILQLDERNERTETKYFLEYYLNTELVLPGVFSDNFSVQYFDSSENIIIQIADVFSNLLYSNLLTNGNYEAEIDTLTKKGLLKFTFKFPKHIDNP